MVAEEYRIKTTQIITHIRTYVRTYMYIHIIIHIGKDESGEIQLRTHTSCIIVRVCTRHVCVCVCVRT